VPCHSFEVLAKLGLPARLAQAFPLQTHGRVF
jgi:hypothetical protein